MAAKRTETLTDPWTNQVIIKVIWITWCQDAAVNRWKTAWKTDPSRCHVYKHRQAIGASEEEVKKEVVFQEDVAVDNEKRRRRWNQS